MYRLSRIPTTAQLRALEAAWIKNCHPNWGMVLMEPAGLSAAKIALATAVGPDGFIDTAGATLANHDSGRLEMEPRHAC